MGLKAPTLMTARPPKRHQNGVDDSCLDKFQAFLFFRTLQTDIDNGKPVERQGRKAMGLKA